MVFFNSLSSTLRLALNSKCLYLGVVWTFVTLGDKVKFGHHNLWVKVIVYFLIYVTFLETLKFFFWDTIVLIDG